MPRLQSTEDFLSSIDPELIQYSGLLVAKGFSNTRLLAHLTSQDVLELPVGHRRILVNEVTKIRSPHSKALLTALDLQEMQTTGSPLSQTNLPPKELFPETPAKPKDPLIEAYTYMTPLQKHLATLQHDIDAKEHEMEKVKVQIDSVTERNIDDTDSRPHCSICHELGHRRNRCAGQKCPASVCCGKVRLHKDELKQLDTMKATLKKMVKDKLSLDAEAEKTIDTINQNNKSFVQAVRGYLINSNKHKYLTTYAGQVVPLSKVINIDLSILQKYFNNKVPDNITVESQFFQNILAVHQQTLASRHPSSLTSKLHESLSSVERRISPSHQDSVSTSLVSPTNPTNLYSQNQNPYLPCPPPTEPMSHEQRNLSFTTNLEPRVTHNFDKQVSDLSRHFDDLHSPPRKMQRINQMGCNDSVDNPRLNANPFYFPPQPGMGPNNPTQHSAPFPPWHEPDVRKKHYLKRPPATSTASRPPPDMETPKLCTGESPPAAQAFDYSLAYDQFNLKPKTAFANRYSSEAGFKQLSALNEPELD